MHKLHKRISKELENIDYSMEDNLIELIYKNKNCSVILNEYHPFRPPKVYVNGICIKYRRSILTSRIKTKYLKQYKKCVCCDYFLCENKWSPAVTIIKILNEHNEFVENVKKIINIVLLEKTKLPNELVNYIVEYL